MNNVEVYNQERRAPRNQAPLRANHNRPLHTLPMQLLFVTFSHLLALVASQVNSDSGSTLDCTTICTRLFAPVCGSDSKTYSNACVLRAEKCLSGNKTLTIVCDGECPSDSGSGSNDHCLQKFACPALLTPVCGSDGHTYDNDCELKRAQCSDPALTLASTEECGSDGEGYGVSASSGDCENRACIDVYLPVCGSDGVTYGNRCVFRIAQCANGSLSLASNGRCPATSGSTSREEYPVCT